MERKFSSSVAAVQGLAAPCVLAVSVALCLLACKLVEISGLCEWFQQLSGFWQGTLIVLMLPFVYAPPLAMFLLAMAIVVPTLAGIHFYGKQWIRRLVD